MRSKRATPSSNASPASSAGGAVAAGLFLLAASAAALAIAYAKGTLLHYGDAEAHLNIARRILDSRQPGYEQLGTVWLPLPHLATLALVKSDTLWRNGLAGALPSAACFVCAGMFLYLGVRRAFGAGLPAAVALAVYTLNPNLLYLQSTPMTEAMLLLWAMALFWCVARLRDSGSAVDAACAGLVTALGTLTRYEMWFVIPVAALLVWRFGGLWQALLYGTLASVGPLYWLAHNWVLYSNPLEFYNGWWGAKAIYQRALDAGGTRYPGDHDWLKSIRYYAEASQLAAGRPLFWLGLAGLAAALLKRAWWAVALMAAIPLFYLWSMYSGSAPIHVPTLLPNSYYNTRYAIAVLPLAALGAAAWVALVPLGRGLCGVLVVAAAVAPWLAYPRPSGWVCWQEAEVNSQVRRSWTRAAAGYLGPRYKPGAGVFTSFGDLMGIYREAGIALKETLHEGDGPMWEAALQRPDLFLKAEWVVAREGDRVWKMMQGQLRRQPRYEPVRSYTGKDNPSVEIYRRIR